MNQDRKRLEAKRKALREEYKALHDRLVGLLHELDPIGISSLVPANEFSMEVSTILPRLRTCTCAEDVQRVVHEEFCHWFDVSTAGSFESYERIGREVWAVVRVTRFASSRDG